jgi:hypothetical protein
VIPALARRLRWRARWSWWIRSGWFRFAHKPLCRRFEQDVIRIGRLRFCRSCAALAGGIFCGGAAWAGGLLTGPALWVSAGLGLGLVTASLATSFERWPRPLRSLHRFATGCLPALALACGFEAGTATGMVALAWTLTLYLRLRQRHRRTRAEQCAGCPELKRAGLCSGYRRQAVALRRYDQEMHEALTRRFAARP